MRYWVEFWYNTASIGEAMAIELTPEQSSHLKGATRFPEVHDPVSDCDYVLVPKKDFAYVTGVLDELDNDPEQQALRRASVRGAAKRLIDEEV